MRRWDVIAELAMKHGFQLGAELGTKEGRMPAYLCQYCPQLSMIAVDLWAPIPEASGEGAETYEDWDFEAIRKTFEDNIKPVAERVRLMQMSTDEAAEVLKGEGEILDFVFIDAMHTYEAVREDINAWRDLVRPGGIIAGHDFQHKFPGVMRAVTEEFSPFEVQVAPDSVWWVRV